MNQEPRTNELNNRTTEQPKTQKEDQDPSQWQPVNLRPTTPSGSTAILRIDRASSSALFSDPV